MNITIKRPWYMASMLKVDNLPGHLFMGEDMAHTFVIRGLDDARQKVPITGTISAAVLRADGGTVWVNDGSIVDGEAQITLSRQCYTVPGRVVISIYSTNGDSTVCIYCGVTDLSRYQTDTSVDPGTIMPSVADLIARIQSAVDSIPPDYSALVTQVSTQGGSINSLNASVAENAGDIEELQDNVSVIGDLSNLVTPTKTDLVSAINEAYEYDPTAAYDTTLSLSSENAVQNKVISQALANKMNIPTSGGQSGQCLMSDGHGSFVWGTPTEVSVVLGALATKDRVQASYTPRGTISTLTAAVSLQTEQRYYPTSASGGGAVSPGIAATCTLPTLTATYNGQNKELTLAWTAGSFVANTPTGVTLPTFSQKATTTGVGISISRPTFTGVSTTIVST